MVGDEAVIVAGIGCRRFCPADEIVSLVHRASQLAASPDMLAAPDFKRDETSLHDAARQLGLELVFITADAMAAAQPGCITRSARVQHATGLASIAEAVALAHGGTLLLPRIASARATCALATRR